MSRYRWVDSQKADGLPVRVACEVAEVSSSAYYEWREREATGPTEAQRAEEELLGRIRAIHADSEGTYGSPRVTAELARWGMPTNHKRVERLMRVHEIVGESGRTFLREAIAQGVPLTQHPGARSALEVIDAFEAIAKRISRDAG